MLHDDDILETEIPPLLQGVLALWRQGRDLRQVYPKPTFYRHRAALLHTLGVDIAAPPPKKAPAAPESGQLLDPAGWDPEPLEGHAWEPDVRPYPLID